jgi:hypothetical protein
MNNNFQPLKMFSAVLYSQKCASQKEIVVFLITLFPLMQSTDSRFAARSLCKRYLLVDHALHVPPPEVFKEREVWWPRRLGLWTKTSTKYEGTVFARDGSKNEGGLLQLIYNTIGSYIMWYVLRQIHSTFQKGFSREFDSVFPLSISTILSLPLGHLVAAYVFSSSFRHLFPSSYLSLNNVFNRQFLSKIWPIQLVYLLRNVRRIFCSFLTLCNTC